MGPVLRNGVDKMFRRRGTAKTLFSLWKEDTNSSPVELCSRSDFLVVETQLATSGKPQKWVGDCSLARVYLSTATSWELLLPFVTKEDQAWRSLASILVVVMFDFGFRGRPQVVASPGFRQSVG